MVREQDLIGLEPSNVWDIVGCTTNTMSQNTEITSMEHGNLVGKTALIDVMGMFMEYMMMNTIELPVWPILRKAGYLSNLVEKLN